MYKDKQKRINGKPSWAKQLACMKKSNTKPIYMKKINMYKDKYKRSNGRPKEIKHHAYTIK
jgi:hypothetical protein